MCLHYVKKCSKSNRTDRLEPASNGCKMSELNLKPARLIYRKVSTGTTGYTNEKQLQKTQTVNILIKAIMT